MKAGRYLKTEIKIVTVDDLDGAYSHEISGVPHEELPEEQHGRNILREKTFNSELDSLVSKIFSNEKKSDSSTDYSSDPIEKNSLLLKCEKLIYQLKHSEDLNSISSNYNPFDTDINVYDDIDDTADYIKAGLLQCGYSKFQILKYNFNDKAYRNDINFLDSSYTSEMYFSIKDPLMLRLQDLGDGFVINTGLINSDPFFSKKFLNIDAEDLSPREFYIIKISDILNDTINFEKLLNNINKFEEYLSPLLLVELTGSDKNRPDEIFKALKEAAALPLMLYLLKNRIRFSFSKYSYEDTLLMIELFIKSAVNSNLQSYIITLKDYSSKDNLFKLKFVLSKIRRVLKKHSMILKISVNGAVIVTPTSDFSEIHNIIDRVNSGAEIIDMKLINYNEYLNSKEFVNLFL